MTGHDEGSLPMSAGELALAFIERFCAGDLGGLRALLHSDLEFAGPQLRCRSAQDYIDALRRCPPEVAGFAVLNLLEDGNTASLRWLYRKPSASIVVQQHIAVRDGRINSIRLEFDCPS